MLFLLALSLIISHDIIPHRHDHEKTVKLHEHAHAEKHGHEDDGDQDDNDLSAAFSFFQHVSSEGAEYSIPVSFERKVCKIFETRFLLVKQFDFDDGGEPPPLLAFQRYYPLSAQGAIPYFFSLKAPPLM